MLQIYLSYHTTNRNQSFWLFVHGLFEMCCIIFMNDFHFVRKMIFGSLVVFVLCDVAPESVATLNSMIQNFINYFVLVIFEFVCVRWVFIFICVFAIGH